MTTVPVRALLSWSSGKDSAWCLHVLGQNRDVEVVGLLTTFNQGADRVAMHAVRRDLVRRQAQAVGLPLVEAELPWPCSNEAYESAMADSLAWAREDLGVRAVAFGDLFLEDIRRYRDRQLDVWGFEGLYPIWNEPTRKLAERMIDGGIRAILTCVDPKQCPAEFAGRSFDRQLLEELPASVDPCGENGEFHTFVFDAPAFDRPIAVAVGETVERDGFVFADVAPVD